MKSEAGAFAGGTEVARFAIGKGGRAGGIEGVESAGGADPAIISSRGGLAAAARR
jgi:hypothetical protein